MLPVRADLARKLAGELHGLTNEESPVADSRQAPVHAQRSVEDTSANLWGDRCQAQFACGRCRPGRCGERHD